MSFRTVEKLDDYDDFGKNTPGGKATSSKEEEAFQGEAGKDASQEVKKNAFGTALRAFGEKTSASLKAKQKPIMTAFVCVMIVLAILAVLSGAAGGLSLTKFAAAIPLIKAIPAAVVGAYGMLGAGGAGALTLT